MSESLDREIQSLQGQMWSARDPEGRAFAPLADALRRKGDLDEATTVLEDGTLRLPDFLPGHLVAALVERDRGNRDGARDHLDRVLGLDAHNVVALFERGCLALKESRLDAALGDLREALRLEPTHCDAREWLAAAEEGGDLPASPVSVAPSPEVAFESELESAPESALDPDDADLGFALVSEIEPPDDLTPLPGLEPVVPVDSLDLPAIEEVAPIPEFETTGLAEVSEGPLKTRTMGELYAKQGLFDRAIEVFEHLSVMNPAHPELSSRLEALKLEALQAARARAGSARDAARVRTGRTITAYFDELLAWTPGEESVTGPIAPPEPVAVSVAALPPLAPAAVPIESLAPAASAAVPIESLAPSTPAAVPIESLAPSTSAAVPIESLAPSAPGALPIESLAPPAVDPVPSGLATHVPPTPSGDVAGGEDMDDFQAWLRSLKP